MNQLRALICFCLTIIAISAFGQGKIRGNVYDKDTGEPIAFATVRLEGTTIGTNTNIDGFFDMSDIEAGNYNLVVTYIGYDSLAVPARVQDNGITYKSLYVVESSVQLETVQISAERQKARTEVKISTLRVTPKEIKALPSTGGEPDIAQYLPVLPGIVSTGDQGGQLYIRGGSPVQNKILLDGMTIYNPFHSIGFFSVFETEIIRSVDVLTGGFNAEHGGRISAIVDIKTREGNKKRFGGVLSANPFQSKVLLEGPIKKLEEGGGSTSFILTGKRSYLNESSKIFYNYAIDTTQFNFAGTADSIIDLDDIGLPFEFTDLYGKLSFVSGNGSKLNLFGFNFRDGFSLPGFAELEWTNTGMGADFTLVPATSATIIGGSVTFSDYKVSLTEQDNRPRTSGIRGFTVGLDFTNFGRNSEFQYGFELNGFSTDFSFDNFLGLRFEQNDFTTELAGFFKYKRTWDKLVLEPSLRLQYYASQSNFSPEPRLGIKYNASDKLRFKAAGGLYSQNLISTVNEEDVVNLFVGFISGPEEDLFKPGTRESVDHRLQKAYHAIFGVEYDFSNQISINVEPYYKGFTQLITINRNKIEATDPDYMTETGEAYGIDFSFKYVLPRTYMWFTYSLGYVRRDDGEQVYPTIFDRRHNINALVTHQFGDKKEWEASARWNFGTGFPFTQTQGFYEREDFENGLSTEVGENNGELGIIYAADRNAGRLPVYHRLDVSLKRTFTFTKNMSLDVTASITNTYNRDNIFYIDRVTNQRVDQLPILPSIGLIFSF